MSWSSRFEADILNIEKIRSHHMLRAFRHRNYRIFFIGESISLSGLWMQRVAMSWLIYRLTGSALMLGAVEFAGQIPVFFLGIFAGVMLEKMDLRKVIFLCQALSMFHAFTMAVLTLSGHILYWHILVLSVLLGIVNAFEIPARQAFVVHVVEGNEDLGNAIALNSSLFNAARLIGPSIGGVTIAAFGEGLCFILNGFSYFATLIALMLMRVRQCREEGPVGRKGFLKGLGEGLVYAGSFIPIRNTLLVLALISFTAIPYIVLLPVFAREILGGGPQTLGFLMASSGVGALIGSLRFALRKSPAGLGKAMAFSVSFFGLSVSSFAFSRILALSMILMGFVGFSLVSSLVSCNTYIQSLVDDDKRSRVMSLYIVSVMGIYPIGSLFTGWIASIIGAPLTFLGCGALCFLAGVVLWRKTPQMEEIAHGVLRQKGHRF